MAVAKRGQCGAGGLRAHRRHRLRARLYPRGQEREVEKQEPIELKMVGSGSYAHVYSYVDPDYGIKFAIKRARKDLDERDLDVSSRSSRSSTS